MLPRMHLSSFPRAAAALVLFWAAPVHLLAQNPSEDAEYVLRPGDRVTTRLFTAAGAEVQVVEGQRIVDRKGDVFLPFVGLVHVAGLDELALRDVLRKRYSEYYADPVLDIKVELRVNITGSVNQPGQYFLDPTATIIDAISTARGAVPEVAVVNIALPSDMSRVRLLRDGKLTILNLRPEEVTPEVLGMRVQSGDWIHVPPRGRSRIRDEITFWGSLVSFASSVLALIILAGR
ncbi:MAG: polysaccharide biosynthesis/export family protein [Gemmatimonadota bacterium]